MLHEIGTLLLYNTLSSWKIAFFIGTTVWASDVTWLFVYSSRNAWCWEFSRPQSYSQWTATSLESSFSPSSCCETQTTFNWISCSYFHYFKWNTNSTQLQPSRFVHFSL